MKRLFISLAAFCALILVTAAAAQDSAPVNQAAIAAERPPEMLSAYRFFRDHSGRSPNAGVTPYDLNTPLWSDGALKFRYVFVPPGQHAQYNGDRVFEFPVGTVLIKTFAVASAEELDPGAGALRPADLRLIETRLLIRRAEGWVALPYVWNETQTDARLTPVGAIVPIRHLQPNGDVVALDWEVPNRNQCKGCHDRAGEITPIGPSARNLNRNVAYAEGTGNQLTHWRDAGMLDTLPARIDQTPNAYDPASGPIDRRARAYLDVNCAHCHNPEGPAHTSGLDLSWSQSDPVRWGVYKRPVAAGRASAGFDFSIEPGHPERSILLHRMASDDPGVMMPELGRQLSDERAIALMREWIAGMAPDPLAVR